MFPFTAGPSEYCTDEAKTSATTATRSHVGDSDSTATLLSDRDSDSSYDPSEDSVVPPSLVTNDSDTRYPGLQLNSVNYSVDPRTTRRDDDGTDVTCALTARYPRPSLRGIFSCGMERRWMSKMLSPNQREAVKGNHGSEFCKTKETKPTTWRCE